MQVEKSAGVAGRASTREWKEHRQRQKKEMKIRSEKEKKRIFLKAQEMSRLLRNIGTRKELRQIWMSEEITNPISENQEVSDI